MGNDGARVDLGELRTIASKLQQVGEHLNGPAKSAPKDVDAGPSSAALSSALSEIMRGAGSVGATAGSTGNKVDTAKGSYDNTENNAIDSLEPH